MVVPPADRAPDETRYHALLEDLEEGVIVLNDEHRIVATNPAASRILGWSADVIEGMTPLAPTWPVAHEDGAPLPDEDRPAVRALRTAEPTGPSTIRVQRPDGSFVWVSVTARPVFDDHGSTPAGVVMSFVDVTERREIDAELRARARDAERLRAQREQAVLAARLAEMERLESLGRLARGIAHDFRNVLGVIGNHAEVVAGRLGDASPVADDVARIQQAVESGAQIVDRLLPFSVRGSRDAETFDVRDAIDLVVGLVRSAVSPATLEWQRPASRCVVHAERAALEQAVLNVVLNARDALDGDGRIAIDARPEPDAASSSGSSVVVTVRDDGVGMPAAVRDRAFEAGFTTKAAGSGLGLSTVETALRAASGRVTLDSAPGAGTTVRLVLPLAPPGAAPGDPPAAA